MRLPFDASHRLMVAGTASIAMRRSDNEAASWVTLILQGSLRPASRAIDQPVDHFGRMRLALIVDDLA